MSSKIKPLLIHLGLLCLIYTVLRALFLVFNLPSYQQTSFLELVQAFGTGLRVDVAAICRTNGVFILLWMLPFAFINTQTYQRFLTAVFLIFNVPFLILNVGRIIFITNPIHARIQIRTVHNLHT